MTSSDPKSISSGLSLPQWMKRIENRFDIDGTPFSPPAHDESFFYIRYPIAEKQGKTSDVDSLSTALQNVNVKTTVAGPPSSSSAHQANVDFSKHTEPCRKYIGDKIAPPVPAVKGQTKSQGTDDGFKGAGAACGSSILKVAQQVVSGRQQFGRGITPDFTETSNIDTENTLSNKEDQQMSQTARSMMRRGSKSLPASPMSSPKSLRKISYNPYFTTYTVSQATENRGWFLSSLLGVQRETVSSTSTGSVSSQIDEEIEEIYESNNNLVNNKKNNPVLKAKPSELREMNFWSPTSM